MTKRFGDVYGRISLSPRCPFKNDICKTLMCCIIELDKKDNVLEKLRVRPLKRDEYASEFELAINKLAMERKLLVCKCGNSEKYLRNISLNVGRYCNLISISINKWRINLDPGGYEDSLVQWIMYQCLEKLEMRAYSAEIVEIFL